MVLKMDCPRQEDCYSFRPCDNKPPNHHIRVTEPCKYWNGEYCTHKIVGVKPGDACNIEKVKRIKRGLKDETYSNRDN